MSKWYLVFPPDGGPVYGCKFAASEQEAADLTARDVGYANEAAMINDFVERDTPRYEEDEAPDPESYKLVVSPLLDDIAAAESQSWLNELTVHYLDSINEWERAHGESYQETAERLDDAIMRAADARWWALQDDPELTE